MADRDFMLDDSGRLMLRNGGVVTGESITQEVALLMLTCKGEMRADPLAGCDLRKMMNARLTRSRLEQLVKVQVERDGKNWSDIKNGINLRTDG
jgi:hypothetical protein